MNKVSEDGAIVGCGLLNQSLETTVRQLSINHLDDLSEALLDFGSSADLDRWLTDRSNT